jgi:starch-binding outer membrane protein, SusD/RagB family
MKKSIPIKAILFIVILFVVSCNEDIMNYPDPNTYNTLNYFNTPDQIQAASTAIYESFLFNAMMGFQWSEMFDVLAAEAEPTPIALPNEPDVVPVWQYIFTNNNACIEHFWRILYRLIVRSNLVIDKAQAYISKNGDDANHIVSMSQGEAYFLRGYSYFQLAFYWGRVPIRTSFDQAGNEDAPRAATVEIVWAQAEKDLKAAQELLPDSWDSENIGRATNGSATGFLGKLYLYTKKYAEADAEFAKLTTKYSLLPLAKYMENFGETNENNQESIFEVQFQWFDGNYLWGFFGSPEGNTNPSTQTCIPQLYGWNDWGNWKFPTRRVADFTYPDESGVPYNDPRAYYTFYGGIGDMTWQDNMPTGPVPYDFATLGYWYKKLTNKENKVTENDMQSGNNIRLMRYADVLLMRAECRLFSDDIPGCIEYINQVRSRVGAFAYEGNYNQTQAFDLLKRERQLELMGEQSRFNDLKRWGILKEVMNIEMMAAFGTSNVEDKHYLFPIPQKEIDSNLGLGLVENQWN